LNIRRGFTLVELVVGMAITSVLMGAMAGAVLISTSGLNMATSAATSGSQAADAADAIARDLTLATSFTERTATAVTFTVPDRNSDNQSETIRYAWSGRANDPLTRQFNNNAVVNLATGVQRLNFSYLYRTMGLATTNQSREQLLMCHVASAGGTYNTYDVDKNHWCAQYFYPSLPANTTAWNITRVRLVLQAGTLPLSNFMVDIRTADASKKPTGSVVQSISLSSWGLPPSDAWIDVPFTVPATLDPSKGYCIVVRQTFSFGNGVSVGYDQGGSGLLANSGWLTTGDGGNGWSGLANDKDMRFYVYGTTTSP
jgi:prepilin-type N-terminal cleavage/methylation domain-containing protein